jgi:hypothetical protein
MGMGRHRGQPASDRLGSRAVHSGIVRKSAAVGGLPTFANPVTNGKERFSNGF